VRSVQASLQFADDEGAAAWAVFCINWRLLAGITGAIVALLVTSKFYIDPAGYAAVFALAGVYWWVGRRGALSSARTQPKIYFTLIALAQLVLAVPITLTLTYVAISIDLPLQDARLLALDRALGFDFRSLLDFTYRHRELVLPLAWSYSSIGPQLLIATFVLPLLGRYRRGAEMLCAYLLAVTATTLVSALVPAIGVYGALGLHASDFPQLEPDGYYDTLRDAPLVRDGELRELSLSHLVGVLTFPSFHAVSAVLYMWAFWPLRWARVLVVAWNALMIVATPLGGGHYLVDVLAGIAVALGAIAATRRISDLCWQQPGAEPPDLLQ
jgi:membrane-associated phospholipid phosphatase